MTTAELEAIRQNFESEQALDTADSRALLAEVDRLQGLLDRISQLPLRSRIARNDVPSCMPGDKLEWRACVDFEDLSSVLRAAIPPSEASTP